MAWTKRKVLEEAYGELALAGFLVDLTDEELAWALRRLDTMMATWNAEGIAVGYAIALTPDDGAIDSLIDIDSGLPLEAVEAVYMNLAVRIAAGKGKQLQGATRRVARQVYNALLLRVEQPEQGMRAGMPAGAGSKTEGAGPRFLTPEDPTATLSTNPAGGLILG